MLQKSLIRPLVKSAQQNFLFSYFSTKTYVVGSQKNCFNEAFLLSSQNIRLKCWVRKYLIHDLGKPASMTLRAFYVKTI